MERTCRKLGFDLYEKKINSTFNFSKVKCGKVKGGIDIYTNLRYNEISSEIYRYTSPHKVRF